MSPSATPATRPRLRIISEYFAANETATGRLLYELSQALQRDLTVEVISGRRPYRAQTPMHAASETLGQTEVIRVGRTSLRKHGTVGRLLDDLIFTLTAHLRALPRAQAVNLVTTSPALLPLGSLYLLKLLRRQPYLYLLYDLYPDIAVASGFVLPNTRTAQMFGLAQRQMLRGAAGVIVLGDCMAEEVQRRYGVPRERIHVVPNWWAPQYRTPAPSFRPQPPRLTFTYAGNIGQAQEFETLMQAMPQLPTEYQVELIGEGQRLPQLKAQAGAWSNLKFMAQMSEQELAKHLATQTDVALITLQPEVSGLAVPSKTYNLLASGLPLLAVMSEKCEIARMVQAAGCGLVVAPGDTEGLKQAMVQLSDPKQRQEMAQRAYALAEKYTLEQAATLIGKLVKLTHK